MGNRSNLLVGSLLLAAGIAGGVWYLTRQPRAEDRKPEAVDDSGRTILKFEIRVDCPGMSAEEVGKEVVLPLAEAIGGATGIGPAYSIAEWGRARLVVPFTGDEHRARQEAAEAIARVAPRLPAGIDPPRLASDAEERLPEVWYSLESNDRSLIQIADIAE